MAIDISTPLDEVQFDPHNPDTWRPKQRQAAYRCPVCVEQGAPGWYVGFCPAHGRAIAAPPPASGTAIANLEPLGYTPSTTDAAIPVEHIGELQQPHPRSLERVRYDMRRLVMQNPRAGLLALLRWAERTMDGLNWADFESDLMEAQADVREFQGTRSSVATVSTAVIPSEPSDATDHWTTGAGPGAHESAIDLVAELEDSAIGLPLPDGKPIVPRSRPVPSTRYGRSGGGNGRRTRNRPPQ